MGSYTKWAHVSNIYKHDLTISIFIFINPLKKILFKDTNLFLFVWVNISKEDPTRSCAPLNTISVVN